MNKFNTKSQATSFALAAASQANALTPLSTSPEPARRLIVLIPADSDYMAVTRRIWDWAPATDMRVQFLGLCKDAAEEPSFRRGLVIIAALVQDIRINMVS